MLLCIERRRERADARDFRVLVFNRRFLLCVLPRKVTSVRFPCFLVDVGTRECATRSSSSRERKTRARALFRLVWSFAWEARFAFVPSFFPSYAFNNNAILFAHTLLGRAKVARILKLLSHQLLRTLQRERERETRPRTTNRKRVKARAKSEIVFFSNGRSPLRIRTKSLGFKCLRYSNLAS